jgi:prepilin-type N-terminal cleavage/methylation domain-containing protein
MKYGSTAEESGFTLIEVIVTVLVVAIFGAMMIVFLSDSIVKSSQSLVKIKKVEDLNKVMVNIRADYNQYPKWRSGVNYNNPDKIIPTTRNDYYYMCNGACPGTANEPDWTTTPLWTPGGLPNRSNLQQWIGPENTDQNNTYGKYHVVKNRCVIFDASYTEQDDVLCANVPKILKVTIRSDQGESLTALFYFLN